MKLYVTVKDVQSVPKENVTCDFTDRLVQFILSCVPFSEVLALYLNVCACFVCLRYIRFCQC